MKDCHKNTLKVKHVCIGNIALSISYTTRIYQTAIKKLNFVAVGNKDPIAHLTTMPLIQ